MGILSNIKNIFSRESGASSTSSPSPFVVPDYYPGITNRNAEPMAVSAVYRCVNFLADSVANLPVQYLRKTNGIYKEDHDSEFHYLLNVQPNTAINAVDFWRLVVAQILLKGNAYIVPEYDHNKKEIGRLVLVEGVSHDIYNDTYNVTDHLNGVFGTFDESEIIHLKGYTINGKEGVSVLSYAKNIITTANVADEEIKNRFANGGSVRGFVSNGAQTQGFGEYADGELEETSRTLDNRFQRGERIVALPGQVSFSAIALSSADMEFLATRKLTNIDVCRFFGVDPLFIFSEGGAANNYKSVEMANVAFLSNTLNPLLKRIETELNRKLVSRALCCKNKFMFDRSALYAADLEGKAKYQAAQLAAGTATVNELRAMENKPAVPNGDMCFVSANLKSVNEFANPIEKTNNDE